MLVGASGCGKSTLLRLIAGFEQPTEGRCTVSGHAAGARGDGRRGVPAAAAVPVADGRRQRRPGAAYAGAAGRRAAAPDGLLHRVGLDGTADRRIWEISGGQQQRVAIARALAAHTPLLLLDEPFAALDALTRERLQEDVRQVSDETGRTSVFVTHSADEAVFLGSRIVVLTPRPGSRAGPPVDLPRTGVDPDELRGSPEYAVLRAEVGHAVKAAAA